nr:acetyltransferase [Hymenolepis microstoma]
MEELDGIFFDHVSAHSTTSKNPFVHSIQISPLRRFQLYLFAILVFPFRLFFMLIFLFLTLLIGEIATRRVDYSKPFCHLRQRLLLPIFIFCGRALFFSGGFIWVNQLGRRACCSEAPILVLAPHSSFYDSLVFLALGMPSVVGKVETAASPFGSFIKMTQPILVNREDPSSRQNTLAEIKRRTQAIGEWPQILIFPEGTCTNRSCLINYKQGAFTVGCPVQPVILRWGYGIDSITWTWDGPGVLELLWLTALQPYTTLEIEFLPVYIPNEAEKDDPQLYAKNVRAVMAKAANLPTTELSFDDCHRIRKAVQFNIPMAFHINEYGRLTKYLFREQHSEGHFSSSNVSHVSDRILAMATAAREWYSATNCEPLKLSKLAQIFLYPGDELSTDVLVTKVAVLKKVVDTLPKLPNGQPDIRILVVHLSFLMFSSSPSVAMQLAFQAFEEVPIGEGVDVNLDDCATEMFTSRVISSADAVRILTNAYHLSTEDATALLPSDAKKGTGDSETITPIYLVQALTNHHRKIVTCYEDYKNELNRLRGQPDRGFSGASSSSNSICSLYGLENNEDTNIFQPGHTRGTSNASSVDSFDGNGLRKRYVDNVASQ